MGTRSNTQERQEYFIDQLINALTDRVSYMSEKQLERIESYVKAELWDRNNQPNGQIFSIEDKL